MASNPSVSYPFDATGLLASNLITNEQHVVNSFSYLGGYLIVPNFAPFFTNNFVLEYTDSSTPLKTLVLGQDYQFVLPYWAATRSIGEPVYGGILITGTALTGTCQMQYQTLGGMWTANVEYVLTQVMQEMGDPRSVIWDVLTNVQEIFPSVNFSNTIDTSSGVDNLVDQFFSLAAAIANKPQPTLVIEGPAGSLGLQGQAGLPGTPGATGPQGIAGPIGATGPTGAAGPQGSIGLIGLPGPQGPQGPVGPAGADGTVTVDVRLLGPATVSSGTVNLYTITNYNYSTVYTASATAGTISLARSQVTFTAPAAAGSVTLTINGYTFPVTVTLSNLIATPSIVSPVNAATGMGADVTITSSAFAMSSGSDTQASSNWQLATDAAFTAIVQQSLADTTNLTSWAVTGLTAATTYYARVQYTGALGETSSYSAASSFSTKASFATIAITSQFTSNVSSSNFGNSVSLSADGTIVLVGAYGEGTNIGAAYIYQNVSGTWTQITRLTGSNAVNSIFGQSVSLSADGTVALISAYGENSTTGAAYIYQNVSGTWTQTSRVSSGVANSQFGWSVSLSADGSTALIGADQENSYTGAAYIYQNVSGTWTQMARLASDVASSNFGVSGSLNTNGTFAIIGALSENSQTGAAYIYQNSAGTWGQIVSVTSGVASGNFGNSVSLSADGSVALIGASGENGGDGAAYIYQNVDGTWTQMARLASGVAGGDFGVSVSLSSDGTIALIGADYEGAAYIYQNSAGTWGQTARMANGLVNSAFGQSVSLNTNGTVAAVADPNGNSSDGIVYIAS